jgi:hypothetical protein
MKSSRGRGKSVRGNTMVAGVVLEIVSGDCECWGKRSTTMNFIVIEPRQGLHLCCAIEVLIAAG